MCKYGFTTILYLLTINTPKLQVKSLISVIWIRCLRYTCVDHIVQSITPSPTLLFEHKNVKWGEVIEKWAAACAQSYKAGGASCSKQASHFFSFCPWMGDEKRVSDKEGGERPSRLHVLATDMDEKDKDILSKLNLIFFS